MRGGNNDPGDRPLLQLAQRPGSTTRIIDVDDHDVTTGPGLTTAEIDPVNCSGTDPEITLLSADLTQNPGWTRISSKCCARLCPAGAPVPSAFPLPSAFAISA